MFSQGSRPLPLHAYSRKRDTVEEIPSYMRTYEHGAASLSLRSETEPGVGGPGAASLTPPPKGESENAEQKMYHAPQLPPRAD